MGVGRPYDEVASVITKDFFAEMGREQVVLPQEWRDVAIPAPVAAMLPHAGAGPGYSLTKSQELIGNRYRRFRELLCQTLPRIKDDPDLQNLCRDLQGQGWKDWHLLMALGNARINFRSEQSPAQSLDEMRARMEEIERHPPEMPDEDPLPKEWLTAERLTELRRFAFMTGARFWGLEIHQNTPDMKAIEQLLGQRYGYWVDDVPHDPLF
jgi:hypothetical protein